MASPRPTPEAIRLSASVDAAALRLRARPRPLNTCLPARPQLEAEYLAAARANKNPRRPVGLEHLPEAAPATTNALLDFKNKKNKKR